MSLDVVTTGGDGFAGQIQNMAGNVSEWVADVFDSYAGPCWQQGPVLVDPVCTSSVAKSSTIHAQRGGSWQLYAISAYVYARGLPTSDRGQVSTGFRCAMSM
jgi:formylglycine-generating enzyme required for sulfatase activity